MKIPKLEESETWEQKRDRVLEKLRIKGVEFIEKNLHKLEEMEK